MDINKFQKRFLLFIIAHFLLTLGSLNILANFKVLPSWFSLFFFFSFIGNIIAFVAYITIYKANRNFLRAFIAFIIFLILSIFFDACSKSKDDFYLTWSRGLEISASFVLCASYVYFFFGIHDYFHSTDEAEGKKKTWAAAIVTIALFAIQQIMAFISSLSITKQHVVFYSVCRFGSWGLSIATYVFILVGLITAFILIKKRPKEELTNEKNAE